MNSCRKAYFKIVIPVCSFIMIFSKNRSKLLRTDKKLIVLKIPYLGSPLGYMVHWMIVYTPKCFRSICLPLNYVHIQALSYFCHIRWPGNLEPIYFTCFEVNETSEVHSVCIHCSIIHSAFSKAIFLG